MRKRLSDQKRSRKRSRFPLILFIFLALVLGIALFLSFPHRFSEKLSSYFGSFLKGEDKILVELYFSDERSELLVAERRKIRRFNDKEMQAKESLIELIKGSEENLIRTIPSTARLISLRVEKGVALVNLSKELIEDHPGGSRTELMTVYSIVDTLVINFPQFINSVQILVEGQRVKTLKGHLEIQEPFRADPDLIKQRGVLS